MQLTNKEINLLFEEKKDINKIDTNKIKIPTEIINTIKSFGQINLSDFIEEYKKNIILKLILHNKKIDDAINKFNFLINKEIENFDVKLKEDVIKTSKYLFEKHNFNQYKNPLHKIDGKHDDISCDSLSGFDGTDGTMECWDLEYHTKTSEDEINLADVFGLESWSDGNIFDLVKIAQVFCNIGFDCWFFDITTWRLGYDYICCKFEPNRNLKEKPKDVDCQYDDNSLNDVEMFRIYIDKYK